MITPELLDILACPSCKGALEPNADHSRLLCRHCGLNFPVRDGIPIMLIDEAERVS